MQTRSPLHANNPTNNYSKKKNNEKKLILNKILMNRLYSLLYYQILKNIWFWRDVIFIKLSLNN